MLKYFVFNRLNVIQCSYQCNKSLHKPHFRNEIFQGVSCKKYVFKFIRSIKRKLLTLKSAYTYVIFFFYKILITKLLKGFQFQSLSKISENKSI